MLVALGTSAEAWATTGLAWQWPDAGWRYHLVARVHTPQQLLLMNEFNAQTRITDFQIDALLTCKPVFRGKSSTDVVCDFEDFAFQITPIAEDETTPWPKVVEELDRRWSASHVQLTVSRDGRLRAFDVEGVDQDDPRLRENFQTMRMIMARAFAAFDLALPAKGDDKGRGAWTQSGSAAVGLLSLAGEIGVVRITHTLGAADGAKVAITSSGAGVLTSGPTSAVSNYFDTTHKSDAVFDTARGVLVERHYLSRGELTASSYLAQGHPGLVYVQMATMTLLEPGAEPPALPASGRLPAP